MRRWRCPVDDADLDALVGCRPSRSSASAHAPTTPASTSRRNALAVVEICRRFDGLPLAIELAAARCTLLVASRDRPTPRRRARRTRPRARDAPARQRTLRATIDWSFDLLADAERDAFTACAVFAGGCTVRAGEDVTEPSLDTPDSLVRQSLLVRRGDRLVMLETMRQYAGERLQERTAAAAVHRRHALHYRELAERAEAGLVGADRARWLASLDAEDDNFRTALRWALDRGEPEVALRLAAVVVVDWFWRGKGLAGEGLSGVDAALRLAGPKAPAPQRAKALLARALLSGVAEEFDQAQRAAHDAHRLYAALDDARGSASSLIALARIELNVDRVKAGAIHASTALELARAAHDDFLIAEALGYLAATMPLSQGRRLVDEAAARYRSIGNLHRLSAMLSRVSYMAMAEGEYEAASELLERATDHAETLAEPFSLAVIRGNQGLAALFTGDTATAATAFIEEVEISREQVVPSLAAEGIGGLGGVAALRGETDRAARLCGAFLEHTRSMRYSRPMLARAPARGSGRVPLCAKGGALAQLGGSLIVAGAGVAVPGPRRQYEQQSRVGKCSHGVALSGLEHRGKPRPSDRAGDVDLTGDDHDVSALVDLVVLQPLSRGKRDEDRARLATGRVQDPRLTRLYFERVQIPVLHRASLRRALAPA